MYRWELDGPAQQEFADLPPAARASLAAFMDAVVIVDPPAAIGTRRVQRVTLAVGESRTLTFLLGPGELRYWNAAARDWVIDTTTIDVFVGSDWTAELTTSFTIGS